MTNVAVVTGAAAGIGLAVVERLAADGDTVVAVDRDAAALERLGARAHDEGWTVVPTPLDVASDEDVRRCAAELAERYESIAAYAATKGALLSLVKAMAVDHAADGVRVNAVCPGSVDTPMLRTAAERFGGGRGGDEVVGEWGRTHPVGRVAQPAEVADAVAYLAGPGASFVTGTDLLIDGGVMAALGVALPEENTGEE
ncbi:short subunit dehydrogenase [Haloactinopolyspora alba]|uniref:Short subunit dehydrogenase n=1 Tax=Haloactinopolyspora alba TaxID=648780 RepID=A0A2P8DXH7_9ACTN|nr:SDR family oxidoreductase [Haloactinopolyspora alba]PSL01877.1 short subunit dehydrogenase [Haloactinopolyspora alba]